ncbi:hypothetical protein BGZ50_000095 [Haplosporangium sp. Z 11]|nr:hypothetical protein BGZ50_000095 [Haplosporangium sp. Z 11]
MVILKKASESSFAALASEALDSRPGSPSGARRSPGSPLAGQQQNGTGTTARKACTHTYYTFSGHHQRAFDMRSSMKMGKHHLEILIPVPQVQAQPIYAGLPHSTNAQLISQLDEAQNNIENFQRLLQKANQEKSEIAKDADKLKEEKVALNEELAEARAIIKAMRSSLEDKATNEFLSPRLTNQEEASDADGDSNPVRPSDPLAVASDDEQAVGQKAIESTPSAGAVQDNSELSTAKPGIASNTDALEEQVRDLQLQLATKDEQYQELERTLEQRTADLTKQKSEHDEKMKKMKAIFAAANKNLNEYRQSIAAKDEEIAELKAHLENPQPTEEQANEHSQAVQELEAELKSQSEAAATKFQQMESKYKQSSLQLEKLKVEYQQYKQRANTLLQQQRESVKTDDESQLKELQEQLEAQTKENRTIANELQDVESRRSILESELQLAMDQIASLESSQEISRRQERQYVRQLKDLERSLKDSQREREAAQSRIASLQELQAVEAQNLMQEFGGTTKHIEERLAKKEEENAELHRILDRSSDELAAAKQEIQNLRDLVSSTESNAEASLATTNTTNIFASPSNERDSKNQGLLISIAPGPRSSFSPPDLDSPISRASSSLSLPTERPPVYSTLSDLLAAKPLVDRSPFGDVNASLAATAALSSAKEREYQVKLGHLTELLNESEANHQRLLDQEKAKEIRNLDRAERRQNLSVDYLKNIVLKYLETSDREPLLPVLTTVLQLSPAEAASLRKKTIQSSTPSSVLGGLFGGGGSH